MIKITQADRDAVAEWLLSQPEEFRCSTTSLWKLLARHRLSAVPAWNFDMSEAPKGVELLCAVEPDRTADELHRAIFGQEANSPNFVVIARRKAGDPKRKVRERYNGRLWNAVGWMPLPVAQERQA